MPLDSERLRRVFDAIDTNGDHFLDKEEMVCSVASTGENRSDHNIALVLKSAFKDMDTNKDGKVSIDEWTAFFESKAAKNGDEWAESYFGAVEHVVMEPLRGVLTADGFHNTDTAEGKLTAFFIKHNPEKLKEVRVMSQHMKGKKTEEEVEVFLSQLNEALKEKYGEDLNSVTEAEAAEHEWMEATDEESGQKYWFKADGTSTWEDPHAPVPEPEEDVIIHQAVADTPAPAEEPTFVMTNEVSSPMVTSPSQLPEVTLLGEDGTSDELVLRIEKAMQVERLGADSAPSEGAKQTHLKTEARLRRWHQTITDSAKDESSKTLARNLAESFLARSSGAQSLGNTGFGSA